MQFSVARVVVEVLLTRHPAVHPAQVMPRAAAQVAASRYRAFNLGLTGLSNVDYKYTCAVEHL
jgi:hypothetical protein